MRLPRRYAPGSSGTAMYTGGAAEQDQRNDASVPRSDASVQLYPLTEASTPARI